MKIKVNENGIIPFLKQLILGAKGQVSLSNPSLLVILSVTRAFVKQTTVVSLESCRKSFGTAKPGALHNVSINKDRYTALTRKICLPVGDFVISAPHPREGNSLLERSIVPE